MSYEGRREHLNYERSVFVGDSLHMLFEKLQSVIDLILLFFLYFLVHQLDFVKPFGSRMEKVMLC